MHHGLGSPPPQAIRDPRPDKPVWHQKVHGTPLARGVTCALYIKSGTSAFGRSAPLRGAPPPLSTVFDPLRWGAYGAVDRHPPALAGRQGVMAGGDGAPDGRNT